MMGVEAISDTALLKDEALSAFFEWVAIAHPSTFGRRLAEMRWAHNVGLERIVTGLSERVRKVGQRLVAIDSTVVSVFGEKIEGAELGYNPHKPGRDSYHPLLAIESHRGRADLEDQKMACARQRPLCRQHLL